MKAEARKIELFILIFSYFLDFVGLFMVIPIFAPTFLDPNDPFFSFNTSKLVRTTTLGFLIASYGIGQFIAGPILGELSDQIGRKKTLIIGIVSLVLGYLLGAISFIIFSLPLLFLSRFIIGFASGNGAVLFAAVSEKSSNEKRGFYLGLLTGGASLGVVFGPVLGSHLSESNYTGFFNLATPFWFMTALSLIDLIILCYFYIDRGIYKKRNFNFLTGLANIKDCFSKNPLSMLLATFFFFCLSTESFFVSLPIFALQKFQASRVMIGYLFLCMSGCSAISSLFINRFLNKKYRSTQIFAFCILILFISYILIVLTASVLQLFIVAGLAGFMMVLCWAHSNSMASQLTDQKNLGKVLGVFYSLLSLSIIFGPILVGMISAKHINLALAISIVSSFISLLFFIFFVKKWKELNQ